jgi:hypothetical protein
MAYASPARTTAALLAAGLEKRQQRRDLRRLRRTAVRPARQRRQNLFGALALTLRRRRRPTGEHLPAARGIGGALGVERPLDAQVADRRVVLHLRDGVVLERLAVVVADDVEARTIVRRDERRANQARTGAHRHGDVERAVGFRRHPDREADASVRPHVGPFAVDDQRQLLAGNEAADAEILQRELVLAVGREDMPRDNAAARAEGPALEPLILRRVALREVGRFNRRLPRPDRHPDDARRRRRVRLEQGR